MSGEQRKGVLAASDVDLGKKAGQGDPPEQEEDLYQLQKDRGLAYSRRQVAAYVLSSSRDPTELRAFVQDRVGGRHALWHAITMAGLSFSKHDLSRVLAEFELQEIDLSPLDDLQHLLEEADREEQL